MCRIGFRTTLFYASLLFPTTAYYTFVVIIFFDQSCFITPTASAHNRNKLKLPSTTTYTACLGVPKTGAFPTSHQMFYFLDLIVSPLLKNNTYRIDTYKRKWNTRWLFFNWRKPVHTKCTQCTVHRFRHKKLESLAKNKPNAY